MEIKMLRVSVRPIAVMGGLAVFALSLVVVPVAHASPVDITVDGGQKFQTISALGADINPNSWDKGNLKPALDLLIDQEGMKTFRVGMDMIDWESRNDNSDPITFNWDYYNPIYSGQTSFDTDYAGSNFANTWNVIDYLHHKGIPDSGIELSFMGPGPAWMGGSSLASGQEDEFVEEVLSAAYYGYSHGHTFGLFSPNNEMDISANDGVTMSDTMTIDTARSCCVNCICQASASYGSRSPSAPIVRAGLPRDAATGHPYRRSPDTRPIALYKSIVAHLE